MTKSDTTRTTTQVIEYEYDAEGRVIKQTTTTTMTDSTIEGD